MVPLYTLNNLYGHFLYGHFLYAHFLYAHFLYAHFFVVNFPTLPQKYLTNITVEYTYCD